MTRGQAIVDEQQFPRQPGSLHATLETVAEEAPWRPQPGQALISTLLALRGPHTLRRRSAAGCQCHAHPLFLASQLQLHHLQHL
jgi:hypothetical protein